MTKRLAVVACGAMAILSFDVSPVRASVDFYGFQNTEVRHSGYDTAGHYFDTLAGYEYVERWMGYSQLEISEIAITPKGSYLDIVEDAWFSSDVQQLNLSGMSPDFWMYKGLITIPEKAAVTGLEAWRGDTAYRAVLKPSKYISDATYPDSITLETSLNARIALLQQQTATVYEATFADAALGERKHVRIRYLLPNTGAGDGSYTIPVLFDMPYGGSPTFLKVTVLGNIGSREFTLNTNSGPVLINDTAAHLIPYQSSFSMTSEIPGNSTMQLSQFSGGAWNGNYLLLNTTVTDTLVKQLSKPIQTVFVWRWNAPQQIVAFNGQIKGLSDYGNAIVAQAVELRAAIKDLASKGYRCGLIHTEEGLAQPDYLTSVLNDSSASRATQYLAKFTDQYLYATYQNQSAPPPSWLPSEVQTNDIVKARTELENYCSEAAHLLGDTTVRYRHVVLVSVGSPPSTFLTSISDGIDSILGPITVDASQVQWRGVDVNASFPSVWGQQLSFRDNFYFPAFAPTDVVLRVNTGNIPYNFHLSAVTPGSFAITGRVNTAWDTTFTWTGYDDSGHVTDSLKTTPYIMRQPLDSGLAKLWARDGSHVAETEEIYPGGTFGIVTKATFLQATTADITEDVAGTIPFLSDNEIFAPRTPVVQRQIQHKVVPYSVVYRAGFLVISGARSVDQMELFDISGRLLARVSLGAFPLANGTYRIALRSILPGKASRIIIVRIHGADGIHTFTLRTGESRI